MDENILKEYDAKLDHKHRCIIRAIKKFDRYHVKVFESGRIEMEPRYLASPDELSENTQKMIYGSIRNLKKGKAGTAVDFKKLSKHLKEDE